jgi:hypothetical protein
MEGDSPRGKEEDRGQNTEGDANHDPLVTRLPLGLIGRCKRGRCVLGFGISERHYDFRRFFVRVRLESAECAAIDGDGEDGGRHYDFRRFFVRVRLESPESE